MQNIACHMSELQNFNSFQRSKTFNPRPRVAHTPSQDAFHNSVACCNMVFNFLTKNTWFLLLKHSILLFYQGNDRLVFITRNLLLKRLPWQKGNETEEQGSDLIFFLNPSRISSMGLHKKYAWYQGGTMRTKRSARPSVNRIEAVLWEYEDSESILRMFED